MCVWMSLSKPSGLRGVLWIPVALCARWRADREMEWHVWASFQHHSSVGETGIRVASLSTVRVALHCGQMPARTRALCTAKRQRPPLALTHGRISNTSFCTPLFLPPPPPPALLLWLYHHQLWGGNPAAYVRDLTDGDIAGIKDTAVSYASLGGDHAVRFPQCFWFFSPQSALRNKERRESAKGVVRETSLDCL